MLFCQLHTIPVLESAQCYSYFSLTCPFLIMNRVLPRGGSVFLVVVVSVSGGAQITEGVPGLLSFLRGLGLLDLPILQAGAEYKCISYCYILLQMTQSNQKQDLVFSQSNNYLSVSGQQQTTIYETRDFKPIWSIPKPCFHVCFQYDTGLVAIVGYPRSIVSIYDFKYKRHVKDIDFVSPVLKLLYVRNIILVSSANRITAYDLSKEDYVLYIQITEGNLCFFGGSYQNLQMGYFQEQGHFVNHCVWTGNKLYQLEDVQYQRGRYSPKGDFLVLKQGQKLTINTTNSTINVIKLQGEFVDFVFSPVNSGAPSLLLINRDSESRQLRVQSCPLYRLQSSKQHWRLVRQREIPLEKRFGVFTREEQVHVIEGGTEYIYQLRA